MLLFSPCAQISEVKPAIVIQCVLYVMYRWGFIKCFRFDNGLPFGDPKRERLSACALHLIARGCQVKFNPLRTPTKNAKVERCHGTTSRWADAKNAKNFQEFYENLNYAVIAQRERLPSRVCNHLTRIEFYPQLFSNSRKYNPADFDKNRVFRALTKTVFYRKVSKASQISIYGKTYTVGGKHNRGKKLTISLITKNNKPYWQCLNENKELVKQIFAQNLDDETYFKLFI